MLSLFESNWSVSVWKPNNFGYRQDRIKMLETWFYCLEKNDKILVCFNFSHFQPFGLWERVCEVLLDFPKCHFFVCKHLMHCQWGTFLESCKYWNSLCCRSSWYIFNVDIIIIIIIIILIFNNQGIFRFMMMMRMRMMMMMSTLNMYQLLLQHKLFAIFATF